MPYKLTTTNQQNTPKFKIVSNTLLLHFIFHNSTSESMQLIMQTHQNEQLQWELPQEKEIC